MRGKTSGNLQLQWQASTCPNSKNTLAKCCRLRRQIADRRGLCPKKWPYIIITVDGWVVWSSCKSSSRGKWCRRSIPCHRKCFFHILKSFWACVLCVKNRYEKCWMKTSNLACKLHINSFKNSINIFSSYFASTGCWHGQSQYNSNCGPHVTHSDPWEHLKKRRSK